MMLLDNTVLSNFALVGRIELLTKALGSQVVTIPQVIDEFNDGIARGRVPETKAVTQLNTLMSHFLQYCVNLSQVKCFWIYLASQPLQIHLTFGM